MSNNLEFVSAAAGSAMPTDATLFHHTGVNGGKRPHHAPRGTIGTGSSIAQYGEILQGQMEHGNGSRRQRFLLSLPCNLLYSQAVFTPQADADLKVTPPHKKKVKAVTELTLRRLGYEGMGGSVVVESNIEEGKGCGSSTADCVAAVHAVAHSMGQHMEDEEVARLVVEAEQASDNFMFKRAVLFAHREGAVLEDLGPRLPELEVLGFDTEVDGAVDTLKFPPAKYTWRQIQCFHTLVSALRRAIACKDVFLLGRVATASAVMNEHFLPKPMFAEIRRVAECGGALGVCVAHSGTVMSILLSRSDPSLDGRATRIQTQLELLGIKKTLRFHT